MRRKLSNDNLLDRAASSPRFRDHFSDSFDVDSSSRNSYKTIVDETHANYWNVVLWFVHLEWLRDKKC